jgi:GMP synthase-like glutamine amidotransferase
LAEALAGGKASPMKLAILETGRPPADLEPRFGDYPAMFSRLLGPEFEIGSFDVQAGQFPDPSAHGAVLITGSPAGVYDDLPWIPPLLEFIRAAGGAKMVGVCFGHQAIAQALGGNVVKSDKGWGTGLHRYQVTGAQAWIEPVPGSGRFEAAEQQRRRLVRLHALCRACLDGPAGDFLSVSP